MNLSKAVAMRATNILLEKDMSQYRLLKNSGLTQSTWQNIIKEKSQDIKLSTILAIATGLNMTLKEFFDDPLFDTQELGD